MSDWYFHYFILPQIYRLLNLATPCLIVVGAYLYCKRKRK